MQCRNIHNDIRTRKDGQTMKDDEENKEEDSGVESSSINESISESENEESEEPSSSEVEEGSSEESSSDDDSDDESEGNDQDTEILRPQLEKPRISRDAIARSAIASALPDFLAQLRAANEVLEEELTAGTIAQRRIEIDENGEQGTTTSYIEMNLDLGVLEERRAESSSASETEAGDSPPDTGIMDSLLGAKRKHDRDEGHASEKKKPKIQEL